MLLWYQSSVIKLHFTGSDITPIKSRLLLWLHYAVLSSTSALCDVIFICKAWLPSCLKRDSRAHCVQEWSSYSVPTCWEGWDGNVFHIYKQSWNTAWVAQMGKLSSGRSRMVPPGGPEPKTISEMLLLMADCGLCAVLCLWFHITQYRWRGERKKDLGFRSCKSLSQSLALLWRSGAVSS